MIGRKGNSRLSWLSTVWCKYPSLDTVWCNTDKKQARIVRCGLVFWYGVSRGGFIRAGVSGAPDANASGRLELYSVFLPQQLFHPGFQRPVGAEQADVLFKIGIQLCRRFSVYLFHDGGGVRPGVHFHIPLSAVDREQPVGEGARDGVGEGAVVREESLPVQ